MRSLLVSACTVPRTAISHKMAKMNLWLVGIPERRSVTCPGENALLISERSADRLIHAPCPSFAAKAREQAREAKLGNAGLAWAGSERAGNSSPHTATRTRVQEPRARRPSESISRSSPCLAFAALASLASHVSSSGCSRPRLCFARVEPQLVVGLSALVSRAPTQPKTTNLTSQHQRRPAPRRALDQLDPLDCARACCGPWTDSAAWCARCRAGGGSDCARARSCACPRPKSSHDRRGLPAGRGGEGSLVRGVADELEFGGRIVGGALDGWAGLARGGGQSSLPALADVAIRA